MLPLITLLFLHFYLLFALIVVVLELLPFTVFHAIFDMKRKWQMRKHVLIESFKIVFHIDKEGFLVVHVEVVFYFVVQLRFY